MDEGRVNQDYDNHSDDQSIVIYEREGEQIRMTVSEFRGNLYFGIRYWLLTIDDEWIPTKSGFSWPYTLDSTSRLFNAFTQILSKSEVLHEVEARAKEIQAKTE